MGACRWLEGGGGKRGRSGEGGGGGEGTKVDWERGGGEDV